VLLGTFRVRRVEGGSSPAVAATRAYIANTNSNTVSVIDTVTNTVTATIPVGVVYELALGASSGSPPCGWLRLRIRRTSR
jgi:YVTN family beta-propeller protein